MEPLQSLNYLTYIFKRLGSRFKERGAYFSPYKVWGKLPVKCAYLVKLHLIIIKRINKEQFDIIRGFD